jgi:hypothetical protein
MPSSTIASFLMLATLLQAQPEPLPTAPVQRMHRDFLTSAIAGDLNTRYDEVFAFDMINNLCSQEPDRFGYVYGAINHGTMRFMTWADYRNGPGAGGDPLFLYSSFHWETFQGRCKFEAGSTWVESLDSTDGPRWENWGLTPWDRFLTIDVRRPAFKCTTTLISQQANVRDQVSMMELYNNLPGIPGSIMRSWDWNHLFDTIISYTFRYNIPPCREARLVSIRTLRTVRANWVFRVQVYCWSYGPGAEEVQYSWRGQGGGWRKVYSPGGYIDGTALTMQLPDPKSIIRLVPETEVLHGLPCS